MLHPLLANLDLFYHSSNTCPWPARFRIYATPHQKWSDARHLASPSARHLLVICPWSTARHSTCQSVHLCRLLSQQPQRLHLMFLSQGGRASESRLQQMRISRSQSFFNETPLWSGQLCLCDLTPVQHREQVSLLPSCYVDSMMPRPNFSQLK